MQGPDGELLVTLWGWSQDSVAEAAAMARDRLSRMAHLGGRLPPNEYYPRTPLREEVLHELTSTDGTLLAVVTRNRYGAQVLNTDAVVFVDVDVAEQRRGFWARLRREPAPTSAADAAVARISAFATTIRSGASTPIARPPGSVSWSLAAGRARRTSCQRSSWASSSPTLSTPASAALMTAIAPD